MTDLRVENAQYYLAPADGSDVETNGDGIEDGLMHASPDSIAIYTGTQMGTIDLDVRVLAGSPGEPEDPDRHWDVIVERSFSTASGARRIWAVESPREDFPTIPAGGTFRLRAHARGRDSARFGEPGEEHLLLIWPAPMEPGETYNMDHTGQQWLNPDVDFEAMNAPPGMPQYPFRRLQRAPSPEPPP